MRKSCTEEDVIVALSVGFYAATFLGAAFLGAAAFLVTAAFLGAAFCERYSY
jgi:hypothetical protein